MFITACNECGNSPPNSQYMTYVYTPKAPLPKITWSYRGGAPPPPLDTPLRILYHRQGSGCRNTVTVKRQIKHIGPTRVPGSGRERGGEGWLTPVENCPGAAIHLTHAPYGHHDITPFSSVCQSLPTLPAPESFIGLWFCGA